jgi:polyhydroxyalkanoate synthase
MASLWNRVPSQLVHLPFWWLDPAIKFKKLTQLAASFERPGYIEHFFANETWNHDNVDLPGGVFRSWIGELYQRNALVAGELVVGGRAIDVSEIRCPKLVVSGTADTITPPACAEVLPGARVIRLDASHVGVLTSRRALTALADACATWLGERA